MKHPNISEIKQTKEIGSADLDFLSQAESVLYNHKNSQEETPQENSSLYESFNQSREKTSSYDGLIQETTSSNVQNPYDVMPNLDSLQSIYEKRKMKGFSLFQANQKSNAILQISMKPENSNTRNKK